MTRRVSLLLVSILVLMLAPVSICAGAGATPHTSTRCTVAWISTQADPATQAEVGVQAVRARSISEAARLQADAYVVDRELVLQANASELKTLRALLSGGKSVIFLGNGTNPAELKEKLAVSTESELGVVSGSTVVALGIWNQNGVYHWFQVAKPEGLDLDIGSILDDIRYMVEQASQVATTDVSIQATGWILGSSASRTWDGGSTGKYYQAFQGFYLGADSETDPYYDYWQLRVTNQSIYVNYAWQSANTAIDPLSGMSVMDYGCDGDYGPNTTVAVSVAVPAPPVTLTFDSYDNSIDDQSDLTMPRVRHQVNYAAGRSNFTWRQMVNTRGVQGEKTVGFYIPNNYRFLLSSAVFETTSFTISRP